MNGYDPGSEGGDRLDELIRQFAEGGYSPGGTELPGEEPDSHGHDQGHGHGHGPSIREFEYRGHTVRIVTHYEVTIDGEPWEGAMQVGNDGSVTYHGLPQYIVPSAVDLVRGVIDHSYEAPDDVRAAVRAAREEC